MQKINVFWHFMKASIFVKSKQETAQHRDKGVCMAKQCNMEAPLPTRLYIHVLLYKHQLTIELVNSLSNPPGFVFSTDRYIMLLIHDCTCNWFSGFHMIIKSIVQMLCLDACTSTLTYHVCLCVRLTCTVIALHSYVRAYTVHVRYVYMNVLPTWVYVNVLMLYSFQYMKYVGKVYILVTA